MEWYNESELIFDASVHQVELLASWKKFIDTGEIEPHRVPQHIAESWKRSRTGRVDPFSIPPSSYLDPVSYEKRKSEQKYLTSIAKPFMIDIYKYLEQSRYLVVLFDADGYHLCRVGQRADFDRSYQYSMIREGLCFGESTLGTTGFALAKRLGRPIQIIGSEHYVALLHYVLGSYAPIRDPEHGDFMGVVGIAGARTMPNPHTLALAAAAGTAIENSLRLDRGRKIFFFYGKALQNTMDSLEDGIVIIDNAGKIYEINRYASDVFGVEKESVKGQHISEALKTPDIEKRVMDTLLRKDVEGKENEIEIRGTGYLTSMKFVKQGNTDVLGVIVQLKSIKNLSQIVHRISGDQAKFTFENMIGSSEKSRDIRALAKMAACSDANIIIEGESGTGKEVMAHAIHNASSRAENPLVVLNCAAIPSELLESTLFGHEKGAFTGATTTHIGKFEVADKGTVFLDEIGEMPLQMQVKLLRVIEANSVERVGGKSAIPINIRVIAATNRDLIRDVERNRFRRDLFYRLNVFRFTLPPLRDRKEEIRDFVKFFVRQGMVDFNKTVTAVAEDYIKELSLYNWPGNIRELRNAVQYSLAILDGEVLNRTHLIGFLPAGVGRQDSLSATPWEESHYSSMNLSLLERDIIQKSLALAHGNKSKAARNIGIGRATLYRKLKKL